MGTKKRKENPTGSNTPPPSDSVDLRVRLVSKVLHPRTPIRRIWASSLFRLRCLFICLKESMRRDSTTTTAKIAENTSSGRSEVGHDPPSDTTTPMQPPPTVMLSPYWECRHINLSWEIVVHLTPANLQDEILHLEPLRHTSKKIPTSRSWGPQTATWCVCVSNCNFQNKLRFDMKHLY